MVRKTGVATKRAPLTATEVEKALAFRQPGLRIEEKDGEIIVRGRYVVSDGPTDSGALESFIIYMRISKSYPDHEPLVYETGSEIPRTADRHMYPDGRCCTCIWQEWCAKSDDISFKAFCNGPLYNFFLSQIVFQQTGKWPFGERSHGAAGILQSAADLLGLDAETDDVGRYLQLVVALEMKGHILCPCGSGRRIRDCHIDQLRRLRERTDRPRLKQLHALLLAFRRDERARR